jgi:hypothetical protein
MGVASKKAIEIASSRDPFGQPDQEQGLPLWERAKREQERSEGDLEPLHVESESYERGTWLEIPRLEQGPKDQVVASDHEAIVFGHDSKDGGRIQISTPERVERSRVAAEQVSRMREEFVRHVETFERLHADEGDFSSDQLFRMQDAIIVEALKSEQPSVAMNELLRSMARADKREARTSVLKLSAQLRALETAMPVVDAPTRVVLETQAHLVKQQMYKARRELNPEATQRELLTLADDVQEYLEPVNWRPIEEPSLNELHGRLEELDRLMEDQNADGAFDPIAELRWYALKRERDEYAFMVKAAELRERQPMLYDTDFETMDDVPWDVKLLRAGKELSRPEQAAGAHRQRETSVYRMLRDAYVDPESQDQMVHAAESILKDRAAPESLRHAARLLQQEVKAQRLPLPEALLQRRVEAGERRTQERRRERERRAQKADVERRTPLERIFKDVQPIIADRSVQKDFAKDRAGVIQEELGVGERDLVRLHKAMETFNYHAEHLPPDVRTKLPFTWKEFISAQPHDTQHPPRGLFSRIRYRVKEQFSPRRKMLRQFKKELRRLPSHKQRTMEQLIGPEVRALLGI